MDTLAVIPSSIVLEADLGEEVQAMETHWQLWLLALLATCFSDHVSTLQALTSLTAVALPAAAPVPAFALALKSALLDDSKAHTTMLVLKDQRQQPLPVLSAVKAAIDESEKPLKTLQCGRTTLASLQHALQHALFNSSPLLVHNVDLQPELWPVLINFALPSKSSQGTCRLILTASYPETRLPTALMRVSQVVMATMVRHYKHVCHLAYAVHCVPTSIYIQQSHSYQALWLSLLFVPLIYVSPSDTHIIPCYLRRLLPSSSDLMHLSPSDAGPRGPHPPSPCT